MSVHVTEVQGCAWCYVGDLEYRVTHRENVACNIKVTLETNKGS